MFRLTALYAILGPVIGSFALILGLALQTRWIITQEFLDKSILDKLDSLLFAMLNTIMISVYGLVLAIPLGIIPATASGLAFWFILKQLTRNNLPPFKRLALGSLNSTLVTAVLCLIYFVIKDEPLLSTLIFFCWPAAVAGGVCALFVTNRFYAWIFPEKASCKHGA